MREINTNQKQIFHNLLEETIKEYAAIPVTGDTNTKINRAIVIGANENVLSIRNGGLGIGAGRIARAILPVEEEEEAKWVISDIYHLEQYLDMPVFELHSFHDGECTVLRMKKGKMEEFSVCPDTITKSGLLIHIEWEEGQGIDASEVLTEKEVFTVFMRMFSLLNKKCPLSWEPAVWFNGNRILY
jgi:hypothetical protein